MVGMLVHIYPSWFHDLIQKMIFLHACIVLL